MNVKRSRHAVLVLAVLITACTATPPAPIIESGGADPTQERPVVQAPATARRDDPRPVDSTSADSEYARHPATLALVAAAREAIVAGRYDRAGAKIDQAIRIDSADPWVWYELARLRFARGEFAQSIATARRSSALAGATAGLRFANFSLIAEAERLRGNEAASARALSEARRYESAAAPLD